MIIDIKPLSLRENLEKVIFMKVAIIVPAHNEEKTVGEVVKKLSKYGKVLVIDDASSDMTGKEAKKNGAQVIRHPANRGLGGALRTGFDAALKMKSDAIITIDADGQHRPEEVPLFLEKLAEGYDFVLGKRDLSKYPLIKRIGNFFLQTATNFISGTTLDDTESGYRALTGEALRKMYLKAERYEIAVEIIFEAGRNNLKACNVPVSSPVYVKGVRLKDGIKNFLYLLRRRKRNWKSYMHDVRYVLGKWL